MLRQTNRPALVTEINPNSPISENYRMLRTNLQFMNLDPSSVKALSVSSANPGEGKTTVLVNLAITLAQEGKRVILLDGDFRCPSLHHIFHFSNEIGMTSLLDKFFELKDVVRNTHIPNLDLIPSGPLTKNPNLLLNSECMTNLIAQAKAQYDFVLIDSPPILAVTEAKIIASMSDGVILVIQSGKTKRSAAIKAKDSLHIANANLIGVVLNNHRQQSSTEYHKYYYQQK